MNQTGGRPPAAAPTGMPSQNFAPTPGGFHPPPPPLNAVPLDLRAGPPVGVSDHLRRDLTMTEAREYPPSYVVYRIEKPDDLSDPEDEGFLSYSSWENAERFEERMPLETIIRDIRKLNRLPNSVSQKKADLPPGISPQLDKTERKLNRSNGDARWRFVLAQFDVELRNLSDGSIRSGLGKGKMSYKEISPRRRGLKEKRGSSKPKRVKWEVVAVIAYFKRVPMRSQPEDKIARERRQQMAQVHLNQHHAAQQAHLQQEAQRQQLQARQMQAQHMQAQQQQQQQQQQQMGAQNPSNIPIPPPHVVPNQERPPARVVPVNPVNVQPPAPSKQVPQPQGNIPKPAPQQGNNAQGNNAKSAPQENRAKPMDSDNRPAQGTQHAIPQQAKQQNRDTRPEQKDAQAKKVVINQQGNHKPVNQGQKDSGRDGSHGRPVGMADSDNKRFSKSFSMSSRGSIASEDGWSDEENGRLTPDSSIGSSYRERRPSSYRSERVSRRYGPSSRRGMPPSFDHAAEHLFYTPSRASARVLYERPIRRHREERDQFSREFDHYTYEDSAAFQPRTGPRLPRQPSVRHVNPRQPKQGLLDTEIKRTADRLERLHLERNGRSQGSERQPSDEFEGIEDDIEFRRVLHDRARVTPSRYPHRRHSRQEDQWYDY